MGWDKEELYKKAQKHIQKGQWQKAIEYMEKVHTADRSDPIVTLRLGDLFKKVGMDYAAASYYFKTANIFAENGEITKAAATYKMILRLDPGLEDAQERLDQLAARHETMQPSLPQAAASTRTARDERPRAEQPSVALSEPKLNDMGPATVYYGTTENEGAGDDGDAPHETLPGLVVLGATVGTDAMPSVQVDLSSGKKELVMENFAGSGEPASRTSDEGPGKGLAGGSDEMFMDFAKDVQEPADDRAASETPNPGPAPARKDVEFLQDLDKGDLWELLGRMDRLTYGPGEAVIHEGDPGDSIYIISSGRVAVTTTKDGVVIKLAELGEQDFFGEVAFLTGKPRTATVTAMETTTILELSRAQMDGLIAKHPNVVKVLRMFHQDRVAGTISTMRAVAKGFI